jgi:hypothetical protein
LWERLQPRDFNGLGEDQELAAKAPPTKKYGACRRGFSRDAFDLLKNFASKLAPTGCAIPCGNAVLVGGALAAMLLIF